MSRVSRKEIAAEWGVSTQRIDALVKEGRLRPGRDGKILKAQADEVRLTLNPANVAKEQEARELGGQALLSQDPNNPLVKARVAEQVYRARQRELVVRKMAGELVSRKQVKVEGYEVGRVLQQSLTAFPSRLSAEIATGIAGLEHGQIERVVRLILDREVKRVLSDVVKALEGVAAAEQAA